MWTSDSPREKKKYCGTQFSVTSSQGYRKNVIEKPDPNSSIPLWEGKMGKEINRVVLASCSAITYAAIFSFYSIRAAWSQNSTVKTFTSKNVEENRILTENSDMVGLKMNSSLGLSTVRSLIIINPLFWRIISTHLAPSIKLLCHGGSIDAIPRTGTAEKRTRGAQSALASASFFVSCAVPCLFLRRWIPCPVHFSIDAFLYLIRAFLIVACN